MAEFLLTPAALRDVEDIWHYTVEQWGTAQAIHYVDKLNTGFEALAVSPFSGSACDHVRAGYRRQRVEHHVVYYRIEAGVVVVIRVLHERMDAPRHL